MNLKKVLILSIAGLVLWSTWGSKVHAKEMMPDFGKVNLFCKSAAKVSVLLLIGICVFGMVSRNGAAAVCYAKADTDREKVEEFVTAYYEAHTEEGMETLPDFVEDAENAAEEMMILEVCLELGVEKYDKLDVTAYPMSDGISWLAVVGYELMVENFNIGIPGLTTLMVQKQKDGTFKIWDEYFDNMNDSEREELQEEILELALSDEIYDKCIDANHRYNTLVSENSDILEWVLDLQDGITQAYVNKMECVSQAEAADTGIDEDTGWREFDFSGKVPSYYFFSNAYQWAYHLSNESVAAIAICEYAEDDSEEGTWELRSMRTRYTDQEWATSIFACSEKGRELYILLRELPCTEPEYLVMADEIQGMDGSYSYDSSLTWKNYQNPSSSSEKESGYTIYVDADAYIYDSVYIDEGVNAMTDYLVSTQADQGMEWWLLDDLIYIGKKGYLADMSFSNGIKRVHMMIDIRSKQYSVVEVYDTQEENNLTIDSQAQIDWDDLYLEGAETDFFVNAFQWHYNPQPEKAAACAVKDYAEKIGLAGEEWELTHMYSEDGTVGVVARTKSPDRRLSLLIKGNTYQVIADVHKGDSGEYDLSDGYYSYDSEMKWHSYYEWTINGERENESVYTVRCNEGYYQHDSIYEYQLHRAMQEYLSSINADEEEEWEMLPEKLFVGCHGSLADAWYTNGKRRVHLVVDVWNKTYVVIAGEDC